MSDSGQRPGKLRATQTLVSHMGFVWSHPSLVAIEVAWRWLFGVPFLMLAWGQARAILTQIPPSSAGLDRLELQNPWLSSELLAEGVSRYQAPVAEALHFLLPLAVVSWAIVSGLGRTLLLAHMDALDGNRTAMTGYFRKLPGVVCLQGLWLVALLACLWLWYRSVGWACAKYIIAGAQPELVGYLCWMIFISLGIYVVWALASWTLAMAPLLLLLQAQDRPLAAPAETGAAIASLTRSFSLGRELSGKLMEVSLVLAIVKIMLIVLDMVFSAAPLPFADQFGPDAMHGLYVAIFVCFLVANDYFHVVRMRSFIALWRHYREPHR